MFKKLVFPSGVALTCAGVLLNAVGERYSFYRTDGWFYNAIDIALLPALLGGPILWIVGAIIEAFGPESSRKRVRGAISWAISLVSAILLVTTGNVHGWTFSFFFPAFAGFFGGAILLIASLKR